MTTALALSAPEALARLTDGVPKPEDVAPGWIYAVVILGLFAVTVLLWLSMRKQLRKIDVDGEGSSAADQDSRGA
jgi:hypothetical protein